MLNSSDWLDETQCSGHSHHGRPCSRKLERGEPTHRCLTCGLDDTCVLCKYCFNPEDHVGHNVFVKISCRDDGGICDCGDPEAWKREIHCSCDKGPQNFLPFPEDFRNRIHQVLDVALDYAVDVLAGCSLSLQAAKSQEEIEKLDDQYKLDTSVYNVHFDPEKDEIPHNKWCLQIWDDDRRSIMDMRSTLQLATKRDSAFINMITEHVHLTGKATIAVKKSLIPLIAMREKIKNFNTSIRSVESVMREEMVMEIFDVVFSLCKCRLKGLDPTIMLTLIGEALLRDWQPGVLPKGHHLHQPLESRQSLSDMVNSLGTGTSSNDFRYQSEFSMNPPTYHQFVPKLVVDSPELTDLNGYDPPSEEFLQFFQKNPFHTEFSEDDNEEEDEDIFGPQLIYGNLAASLGADLAQLVPNKFTNWPVEKSRARAKLLIFFDIRFPKILRQKLADIYVSSLLSSASLKSKIALIYADIYPLLVQHHIYFEKDPELSITTILSTQLFTTPSVATTLMESDSFGVYMNVLRRIFMRNNKINHKLFRNRRLAQVFHEIGYLLWRNSKKETVGANPHRIAQAANFLSLFQGLTAMKRQEDKHVEYENEKWVYCYASMPYALTLSRSIAVGIDWAIKNRLNSAITGIQAISMALIRWQSMLVSNLEPITKVYGHGKFQGLSTCFTAINPSNTHVSLLNPVHAFLSWLIEFSNINCAEQLRISLCLENPHSCKLFQPSLCTLSVLSHISVGYWVRNGYALRILLQSYRDATLRDLAYARDLYLTQVAFCILDPNTVFMNLAWSYSVLDFPNIPLGSPQQAFYLLDEFIHCLNNILCDRIKFQGLQGADMKKAILTREIIQILGFKSMPYSELTKNTTENLVVDDQFDLVLSECSNFQEPKGAHGIGMYSLKPELYKSFDPFYTHFTMAQCEEAEKEVEEKLGSEHTPTLLPLTNAWRNLGRFTRCAAFGQFILHVLVSLKSAEDTQASDTFKKLMHLLLMAAKSDFDYKEVNLKESELFNCYPRFVDLLLAPCHPREGNHSILDILQQIYVKGRFSASQNKIDLLFKILEEQKLEVTLPSLYKREPKSHMSSVKLQQLRNKGKEVQKKILEEFQRQQQQFLQNNENDMESDDGNDIQMEDESSEGYSYPRHCVLCQLPDDKDSIFGILTYTTKMRILRSLPQNSNHWVKEAYCEDTSLDVPHPLPQPIPDIGSYQTYISSSTQSTTWGPAFPQECIRDSTIVQGCGHGVHYHCFNDFLKAQHQRRAMLRFSSDHLSDDEFHCPLCRDLNNGFMPVLWNTNNLDATTYLKDPENPRENMEVILSGTAIPKNIGESVENYMSSLHYKFTQAMQRHDFNEPFHINVRNVLLEQMLRIKKMAVDLNGLDKAYGMLIVYRSFADTIAQIEISLRGQAHSTPFGGLIMDQLPTRIIQYLRVFAKYIHTLTGFILSGFTIKGREPEICRDLCLAPKDTFTATIEMLYMGTIAYGFSPKTILCQVMVIEIGRVLMTSGNLDPSCFPSNLPEIDTRLCNFFAQFTNQNPRIVYHILRSHLTLILRRHALIVFAICGKYNPEDFAGLMHLPESDRLCSYLGFSNVEQLIFNCNDCNTAEGVAFRKFFQINNNAALQFDTEFSQLEYPGIYRLIKLPLRLDMMFNIEGNKLPVDPALCLICGEMCSIQCTYLSRETGPCNQHVGKCGVSQGLFLLARRNVVLLVLPKDRGTFITAPYLDLHGEPDDSMRRGRPHYLQPARYDSLIRDIWLWNGLSSLTARKLDQNQDSGGWETI